MMLAHQYSPGNHFKHPLYRAWSAMLYRCYDKRCKEFKYYGGRGITVCQRWRDSLFVFAFDVGPKPSPEHSIDRWPDQNGNYEPGNVRWATITQQAQNRRNNRLLAVNGKTQTLVEWSREVGINEGTLGSRINILGLTPEQAITLPVRRYIEIASLLTPDDFAKCAKAGISLPTVSTRLRNGWSVEEAVGTPVRVHVPRHQAPPPPSVI